ncbi:MAG: HAD-IC family P-type ATPase, partial [Spirochaetia bacterium]|nr:HAD-IC family P-type ATPase [Spirochaetia bacterium]
MQNADRRGLTSQEAFRRLAQYGPNEIKRASGVSPWLIFAGQFKSPVIWLLLGACVISGVLGELTDAIAIGAIVVVNAFVGFFQEYRAERAVLALRKMTAPRANVIRDDKRMVIPAASVVPGDLLVLEAGDIVAADAHLREATRLGVNEASFSGESLPVEKSVIPIALDAPLVEQKDRVFMGTSVVKGTGLAEVFATGMKTELSRIAELISTAEESVTPLQRRLEKVSRILLYICIGIVLLVSALGLIRSHGLFEVFLSGVSLAVAAV